MTWLYVPGICSASATATPEPSSPCDPWHGYEPWLVLSGTPTQRPSSWNGWNNRGWIRALSGMTLSPSTAQRGVDEWISSLSASPVNRSGRPGSGPGLTMIVGSGQTLSGSSVTWNPDGSCWRTSLSLFDMDSPKSSTVLPRSGSMRNGGCSQRPPLAPLTVGNDSGSWPTATARDSKGEGFEDMNLTNASASWGNNWPTLAANADSRSATISPAAFARGFTGTMTDAVRLWGTPTARDDQKSPEAHAAMKARMGGGRTEPTSLTVQTKLWATPRASMNENRTGKHAPTHGTTHGRTLAGDASHLGGTITADGPNGSQRADLNPWFVAALMGLPWDWLTHTTTEVHRRAEAALRTDSPTPSTLAEMGSSLSAPPLHGVNSSGEEGGNCE
jgi:hypothetical protein